jgi:pyrroline-5-carboxylate reductase
MKITFIGGGNMGGAIVRGMVASNEYAASNITVVDLDTQKLNKLSQIGVNTAHDIADLQADIIVIAVIPQAFDSVLPVLAQNKRLCETAIFVSIAAGISINYIKTKLGSDAKVVRAMPNAPSEIGRGMTAVSRCDKIGSAEFNSVVRIFASVGDCVEVDEKQMDAVVALNGSSPAYVYMLIEAMIEAGVQNGVDENVAKKLACATIAGTANMALSAKESLTELCQMVCSPNGTTIEAVKILKEKKFNEIVIEAMNACSKHSNIYVEQKN